MNKKQSNPMEGVVRRQRRRTIGDFKNVKPIVAEGEVDKEREIVSEFSEVKTSAADSSVISMDLDIDNEDPTLDDSKGFKSRRRARKSRRDKKKAQRSKLNNRLRKLGLLSGIAVALVAGFLVFKGWMALRNIIVDRDGGGSPALNGGELRGEGDGRINILLLGIGGEGHDGGNLADTIIIASIDPFAKEVALLSIPRDMYVSVPGYWDTKINAAHAFGEENGKGPEVMKETLEQTLDIPIHYYARVDFTGFVQAVDAVGGVDLDVKEAVYDTHFAGDSGYIVDVPVGMQHFDGTQALYYARSRYSSNRGDFDRNDRQRAIMVAVKDKIFSLGTFSDPRKIAELADSAGNHVRTDLQLEEIQRLYEIMNEIPSDKIASYGLSNDADNYLTSGNIPGAGSVQVPKAGDYSEIQKFVRQILVDGFIRSEKASIEMYDASGRGASVAKAEELKSYGYNLTYVGDHTTTSQVTTIYDRSNGASPYTKRYLEQRFGVTMVSGDQLPANINAESAFVIILGSDVKEEG